ncbi:MAG: hypothetical protein N2Z21_08835 [Candidatus Sumerlaeaceae bacterium]|nr:hypothetical protein [Candidatus Sumerlaeaceae bacterium]
MKNALVAQRVRGDELNKVIARLQRSTHLFASQWYEFAPDILDATAKLFLAPASPWRRRAMELGNTIGMTPPMVTEALRNVLGRVTKKRLEHLRQQQLGRNPVLHRILPRIVFHNLAGNLFISAWESLLLANLIGAGNLVRTSQNDRQFPVLFVEAMASIDPLARRMNFCVWWPHEERELTHYAITAADVVVAFGDDRTVTALRNMLPPHKRFLGHGHKVSFILLHEQDIYSQPCHDLAKKIAYDFSVYDQQGCLSPRAIFLKAKSLAIVETFAQAINDAMAEFASSLPRHVLSLEEAAAVAREREEVLIQQAACESRTARQTIDRQAKVISPPTADYLVAIRSLNPFSLSPVNRTVVIRRFTSLDDLAKTLNPLRGNISTFGVATLRQEWLKMAHALEVGRICPVGKMQKPPLGWTHDGYQPLAALTLPLELREIGDKTGAS